MTAVIYRLKVNYHMTRNTSAAAREICPAGLFNNEGSIYEKKNRFTDLYAAALRL